MNVLIAFYVTIKRRDHPELRMQIMVKPSEKRRQYSVGPSSNDRCGDLIKRFSLKSRRKSLSLNAYPCMEGPSERRKVPALDVEP